MMQRMMSKQVGHWTLGQWASLLLLGYTVGGMLAHFVAIPLTYWGGLWSEHPLWAIFAGLLGWGPYTYLLLHKDEAGTHRQANIALWMTIVQIVGMLGMELHFWFRPWHLAALSHIIPMTIWAVGVVAAGVAFSKASE